jgi:hypothetical protein
MNDGDDEYLDAKIQMQYKIMLLDQLIEELLIEIHKQIEEENNGKL